MMYSQGGEVILPFVNVKKQFLESLIYRDETKPKRKKIYQCPPCVDSVSNSELVNLCKILKLKTNSLKSNLRNEVKYNQLLSLKYAKK